MSDMKWRDVKPVGRREWWLFVMFMFKYMFWTVVLFVLAVAYAVAYVVTDNFDYQLAALLWLVLLGQESKRDR